MRDIQLGLGGFGTRPYDDGHLFWRPYGCISEWVWAGLEPARTGAYPNGFGRV
ncbi:MAG TPA: hypothetical protein PLG58_05495 [Flexilinea sp.]|nr:hypothetical protein [Flexilinea sp.]